MLNWIWAGLLLCMCGVLLLAVVMLHFRRKARILAANYPIASLYALRKAAADYTCIKDISPTLLSLTVNLEDYHFYRHPGYDLSEIRRAMQENIRALSIRRGASTITQQLVKNLYFSFEKRISRKITELFLARMTEKALTKDQILELYLNMVDFGYGQWGIGNAAAFYFGTTPAALTQNQALLLSVMLPAPSYYDPLRHPEHLLAARDRALCHLTAINKLPQAEADVIRQTYSAERLDDALQRHADSGEADRVMMRNALADALKAEIAQRQ